MSVDPLLTENKGRYVLFPINYEFEWVRYKRMLGEFWTAEHMTIAKDGEQAPPTSAELLRVCGLYAAMGSGQIPIMVSTALARLMNEVQIPEARCGLGLAAAQGNVQMEAMAEWLGCTSEKYESVAGVVDEIATRSASRVEWVKDNLLAPELPFRHRWSSLIIYLLLADAHAEVVMRDLQMHGHGFAQLGLVVDRIRRDRVLTVQFCRLLPWPLEGVDAEVKANVAQATRDLVSIEMASLDGLLQETALSVAARQAHLEWLADRALEKVQCGPVFNTPTPLSWAMHTSVEVEDVSLRQSGQRVKKDEEVFKMDEDF